MKKELVDLQDKLDDEWKGVVIMILDECDARKEAIERLRREIPSENTSVLDAPWFRDAISRSISTPLMNRIMSCTSLHHQMGELINNIEDGKDNYFEIKMP